MSGNDAFPQSRPMETTGKSELEDGEIEDETGSENDHYFVSSRSGSSTSKKFHMNVAQWQRLGEPPTSRATNRYFPRHSGSGRQLPQWGKYAASTVSGPHGSEPPRAVKRGRGPLGSRDFAGGAQTETGGAGAVKRRREMNKEDSKDQQRLSRNDNNSVSSTKKTRQFDRKRARRRSRTKGSLEKETSHATSEQEEYEALLRKHHEVQELIKEEEKKLTSERRSLDANEEEVGGAKAAELDRDKSPEPPMRVKSRSRSGSLKKDLAPSKGTPVEEGSDGEIIEVSDYVKSPPVEEVIEILDEDADQDEDDDDDDELLQLRRLALESATKNVAAREEKENQAQKHRAEKNSEYQKARQRERRQKVKQLFHNQSIAAEIFKVHGEKERFAKFMDFITTRRRSLSSSSQGRGTRRSPSLGKESGKKRATSGTGAPPADFQHDNYEQVEMDVSEIEESPTLTPVTDKVSLTSEIIHILSSTETDTSTGVEMVGTGTEDAVAEGNQNEKADADDDDDDDKSDDEDYVMALREQLLRSLATRRAAKAQAQERREQAPEEEYTPEEPIVHGPTYDPSPILALSPGKSLSDAPSPSASSPSAFSPSTFSPSAFSPSASSPLIHSSPLSTPRTQSPTPTRNRGVAKAPVAKTKPKVVPLPIPTHKPVVIQFDGDTDSSDDEHSPQKPPMEQINSLDQFLKEARRTADAKKSQSQQSLYSLVPKTPDAVHQLPEIHRAEYHKLKEEIARREQQKMNKSAAYSGTGSGTQSPVRDVTVRITKVDGKVQRTVVLKDARAKDTAGDVENRQLGKDLLPETAKENPEVVKCQGSLIKHRLVAEKDCRILSTLEKQIQKRHVILRQTEAKLQQLREELAVGERIAASNRSQIKKYIQQKHLIQRKMLEHLTVESHLRENLAKAKGVPVAGIGQSQLMLQAVSRLPKKAAVIGGRLKSRAEPNNPVSRQSETELQRLQRLEREYANQIIKLREESAKQAVRQVDPVPKSVVRILKTKTKLLNKKPSSQLLTKDKIGLGNDTPTNTDSESDAERYMRSREESKRRRSFLDHNPSLKPNLHAAAQISQSAVSKPNINRSASSRSVIGQSASSKAAVRTEPSVSAEPLKPAGSNKSSAPGKAPFDASSHKPSTVPNKVPSKIPSVADGMSIPSEEHVKRLRCAHAEKSKSALEAALRAPHAPPGWDATSGSNKFFSRKTPELKMSIVTESGRTDQDEDVVQRLTPYSSPLLWFRSYRLSPFFVPEAKMSRLSPSFSHKLDPMKALCQFELNGTCNDDECPWQHQKDYEMTDHEVYADLLAYTPLVAASKDWKDPEKRRQRVDDYVNKAVKKSKRPENAKKQSEALCRAFATAVLTQTKKFSPGIIAQPRGWTPSQAPSTSSSPTMASDTDPPLLPRGGRMTDSLRVMPLGGGSPERYFSGEGIADLEAAVLEAPEDVTTWIKLASRIVGDDSEDRDLDGGLNALSRGLEANQSNSELWLQYLLLYSQRDDLSDLSELCQQALQFAPSHDLYWQCLTFEESFPAKDAICDRMIAFFERQQMKEVTKQGSHRLLEALLYRVQLHTMTRRVKVALTILKGAVKGSRALSPYLTSADHCLLWLVHIHTLEYQRLPSQLFHPTGNGLGHIVSKELLIFQWGSLPAIQSAEEVRVAFQEAVSACSLDKSGKDTLGVCLPLYRNWVVLEHLTGRQEKAEEMCRKLIAEFPLKPEPWLLLIDVHKHQGANWTKMEEVNVFKTAVKRRCAAIHNTVAKCTMQNNPKAALSIIKFCVNTFYTIPDKTVYDNVDQLRSLYRSLLGQSLPFDYTPPGLRAGVTPEVVEEQSRHLWLNYCLLQELTSDDNAACDAYEESLCHLKRTEDVQTLWMEYLLFRKSKLVVNQNKREAFQVFTALVNRCLVSMATEFRLPHSDKTWLDYSFHNRVVELYIGCLKDDDCLDMYERCIDRMPNNVILAFRACQCASKSLQSTSYRHRVKAIATDVLNRFPDCLPFWKILIALSLHQGRLQEAKMLYQKAIEAVPLAANLWKDFFLLEVVNDPNPEDIRRLILKCRELKVNIEDYLKTILK